MLSHRIMFTEGITKLIQHAQIYITVVQPHLFELYRVKEKNTINIRAFTKKLESIGHFVN